MELFSRLLPRIYQIVEEINRRYCLELQAKYGMDPEKLRRMAIIADGQIRMAYLAIVGSHSVNGVAALHTEILKHQELKDFYELYPENSIIKQMVSPREDGSSMPTMVWQGSSLKPLAMAGLQN